MFSTMVPRMVLAVASSSSRLRRSKPRLTCGGRILSARM
jgi:hypothetical protein